MLTGWFVSGVSSSFAIRSTILPEASVSVFASHAPAAYVEFVFLVHVHLLEDFLSHREFINKGESGVPELFFARAQKD